MGLHRPLCLLPLLVLFQSGCHRVTMSGLGFSPQEGWVRQQTEGPPRLAQYELPGTNGSGGGGSGGGPATLTIFYFGPQGAGSVEANMERWIGQFQQPDGRDAHEVAQLTHVRVNDLDVHNVDISGTYVAQAPGSQQARNDPDFRMIASVVDTAAGPYYIRFLGPAATIDLRMGAYDRFTSSLRPEPVKEQETTKAAAHP